MTPIILFFIFIVWIALGFVAWSADIGLYEKTHPTALYKIEECRAMCRFSLVLLGLFFLIYVLIKVKKVKLP